TAVIAAAIATVDRAVRANRLKELPSNGRHQPDPDTAPVPPSPQDLPVLRRQRAADRLQGRKAPAELHLGALQDRPVPHHGGEPEEAARTRQGDQARPLPRPASLRGEVSILRGARRPGTAPAFGVMARRTNPSWARRGL